MCGQGKQLNGPSRFPRWKRWVHNAYQCLANAAHESCSEIDGEPTASSPEVGTIVVRIKRIERTGNRAANAIQKIPGMVVGNRRPGDLCVG